MNNKILKNYFIVALIIIIVLAIIVLVYFKKPKIKQDETVNQIANKILYIQKFEDNKFSPYLPKNILENLNKKEIDILENKLIVYENKEKITETKSILKFISNNSKQHNKSFYLDYLNQNFWEIIEVQSSPEYLVLMGRKPQEKEVIQIIINDLLISNDSIGLKTSLPKSQIEIILQKTHN